MGARRWWAWVVIGGAAACASLGLLASTLTASTRSSRSVAVAAPGSPLDPLTPAEVTTAQEAIEAYAKYPDGGLFPIVQAAEPAKDDVLSGQPLHRRAFAEVYDPAKNRTFEATVDLDTKAVDSWRPVPGVEPALTAADYEAADGIVRSDKRWIAAMRARGLNPDDVYLDAWAPGEPLPPGLRRPNDRLIRELSFFQGSLGNPYDRPIEGVVVTVDVNRRKVVDFVDTGAHPVDTTTSGSAGSQGTDLKPLTVEQPQGPSFTVDGSQVTWQRWHFRVGWTPREGLVLRQIGYDDHGATRSVIYRLSLSEIYVPYGIPDPNWVWRAALDVGEYNLGQYSEALQPGLDVPVNAVFFDQVAAADTGSADGPVPLPHAIAMYEQPAGTLWDRTDPTTLVRDTRGSRELVLAEALPIGNYTYVLNYVFRMDGGIHVEVFATGTTLNQGISSPSAYGTTVADGIAAPSHQHFFNFRIDFDVDGTANRLVEETTHPVDSDPGNAFVTDAQTIGNEGFVDSAPNRFWVVQSTTHTNAVGAPTAYALLPGEDAAPLSAPGYAMLGHAQFATHTLWATRYRDGELYAAGDYPDQAPAGLGLPQYVGRGANIDGQDLVLWYTAGFTHVPVVENYPVMTTDTTGFSIVPDGFFDRDPALDAP